MTNNDPMLCQKCNTYKSPRAWRNGGNGSDIQMCWKCEKKEYNLVKFCGEWVTADDQDDFRCNKLHTHSIERGCRKKGRWMR